MYTLHCTSRVEASLDQVFDFFNHPENLEKLTPPFLNFQILTPTPIKMHNGAIFDYRIRLQGIPMHWTSIINGYDPPHQFVDVQLKGPYAFWHHKHTFVQREGFVEIIDDVHYEIGYALLGKLVHAFVIRRQLDQIFSHREKVIKDLFPQGGP